MGKNRELHGCYRGYIIVTGHHSVVIDNYRIGVGDKRTVCRGFWNCVYSFNYSSEL